jgi:hypothetical protein
MTRHRPMYQRALAALQSAHDACFNAPGRDVLGMSHGAFSGVNVVLGMIAGMEDRVASLRDRERYLLRATRKVQRPKRPIKGRKPRRLG